jgi:amino acid adenylation domain-containing protein
MTCDDVYQDLLKRGVKISVSGDLLTFTAPQGALTNQLIALMKRYKQDLIRLARAQVDEGESTARNYPASFGQEALWLLHHTNPTSASYNTAATIRILSTLDVDSLQSALSKLQSRHELLHATFAERDASLQVAIQARPQLDFRVVDASKLDERQLREAVQGEYSMPFDLQTGPLFRVRLFTQSADRHVLLMVFHHIIFDASSLWILQRELQQLYAAELTGNVSLLPALAAHYADFAAWQRGLVESAEGARQWDFWQAQLAGDPAPAELPWSFSRNKHGERRGATHSFEIDEPLSAALRGLAKSLGATPFATSLAVFQMLIHRYGGQRDFIVGATTSGRSQRQFDQCIGYFVNVLPIRSTLTETTTFAALVQETKQRALGAMQAGDFPFPLLVERLKPVRTANAPPLCRIMFGLQNAHSFGEVKQLLGGAEESIDWGGLRAQSYELDQQEGQFDLTLEMHEGSKSFNGLLKYDRNLLADAAAERLAKHFVELLKGVVANPHRPLSDYELAPLEEREQLTAWSSGPSLPTPTRLRFDECFADVVARTPDATALVLEDRHWTYAELDRWSTAVARRFLELGARPGDNVVICLQRRALAPVCLLAALKCGVAIVPVAADSPTQRLERILDECRPKLIITESDRREAIEGLVPAAVPVVPSGALDVSRLKAGLFTSEPGTRIAEFAPSTIAYIIYTSGSSGTPKGVRVSHDAICRHVAAMASVYKMTKADRVLQFCDLTFDPSLEQFLVPWSLGASVVFRPDAMYTGDGFWREIARQRITVANVPPSFFIECSQYVRTDTLLRLMIVGGDVFPISSLPKWTHTSIRLINAYGPTEAVITATTCELSEHETSRAIPIGRAKPGSRALVLDHAGRMVPIGVPGELCLGGPMLAEGYVGDVADGTDRFPWITIEGEPRQRIYRTGDLARWNEHGELEFLGRRDRQIKIRGFRVEPGEIEAALLEHPGVRQAFVSLCEDASQRFIAAHVVPARMADVSRELLVRHLKTRLPLYMVPERFGILESLPLNDSGKVAVDRLPTLPRPAPSSTHIYVPPRTALEQLLVKIWADVLEVERVGIHDDFLELGGGSLQSLRIVSRLNEAGVSLQHDDGEMGPHLLFQFGTIAELSSLMQLAPSPAPLTNSRSCDNLTEPAA